MNHSVLQTLLQWLAAWMVFSLIQKHLGTWILIVILFAAGLLMLHLYSIRYPSSWLFKRYNHQQLRPLRKLLCRLTGTQVPSESNHAESLPLEYQLREERDFPWASARLKQILVGHDVVIDRILTDLYLRISLRRKSNLERRDRPLGIYFIAGPEGIGKRTLAHAISRLLYREGDTSEFNFQSYRQPHDAFVDLFGDGSRAGELLQTVRRFPFQSIILDHFQLSDSLTRDSLTTLFQTGTYTDPQTRQLLRFTDTTFFILVSSASSNPPGMMLDGHSSTSFGAPVDWIRDEFGLTSTFMEQLHSVSLASSPNTIDQARIIAILICEECARYGLEVDYVEPEIIAYEVQRYQVTHGFQAVKSRLSRKLSKPILLAKQQHQSQIILTMQSWKANLPLELSA